MQHFDYNKYFIEILKQNNLNHQDEQDLFNDLVQFENNKVKEKGNESNRKG